MKKFYSLAEVSNLLSVSKETLRRWDKNGHLASVRHPINNYRMYPKAQLSLFSNLGLPDDKPEEKSNVLPAKNYSTIELFAGAGGLALGFEKAGLNCVMLNEIDHNASETLRKNRPEWNVVESDVSKIDFSEYKGKIDIVSGGFPCQAFSYAGKKLGLQDARGTLFFEFARAVSEIQPLICVGENVRGLLTHDKGNTLRGMVSILEELGYNVLPPQVLKAIYYKVPQKRERLLIVGLKKGCGLEYEFPTPIKKVFSLRQALKKGDLYDTDVPASLGQKYPTNKKEILKLIPPGGYWRDLPLELQKKYMQKSFYLGGGKTGIARRISWDEPSLTLTCSPAQKQTERCHPEETRPFTIREYARIQTFPDDWQFSGAMHSQYKQIGNAVPVNLATAIGSSLVKCLNKHYEKTEN